MDTQTLTKDTFELPPQAIIIGIQHGNEVSEVKDDLVELSSLLSTLGIETTERFIQKRQKLSPSLLLGSGKVEELKATAAQSGVKLLVIDHPLSAPQIRNLEKATQCQVLDRSGVILEIFAKHAKTTQAQTQVEIAKLEYLMPRLTGAWTHFHRQAGGGGGGVYTKGMGEKQIEIDRRRARERVQRLQKRLEQIKRERESQRKSRQTELQVAIVGYTNSGKTTLMSNLTRSTTEGHDELFATLDTNIRSLDPSTRPKILLTDTVGFIRNLPLSLVDSFKSTLEEVLSADLLLHVVDVSHSRYHLQMDVTENILEEIGAGEIPRILIFNKMDQIDEKYLATILQKKYQDSLAISAHSHADIIRLREHLYNYFKRTFLDAEVGVDPLDHTTISLIHRLCVILDVSYENPEKVVFKIKAPKSTMDKLNHHLNLS